MKDPLYSIAVVAGVSSICQNTARNIRTTWRNADKCIVMSIDTRIKPSGKEEVQHVMDSHY